MRESKRKKVYRGVGVLTLLLSVQVHATQARAASRDCPNLLGMERLSAQARESLEKASKSGSFEVQSVSQVIDGKEKVVVLLGETHVKGAVASSMGKEVLSHFPLRGLEAARIDQMWGGKFLGVILKMATPFHRLIMLGKTAKGSTIDDAYIDIYVESMKAIALESGLKNMSVADQKDFKVKFSASDYDFEINGIELLELLAQRERLGSKQLKTVENLDIEAGHKPDLAENIASLHIPTTLTVCMATVCASIFGEAVPEVIQQGLGAATLGLGVHLVGGFMVGRKFEDRKWLWILNPLQGIESARNRTMAKNIDRALRDRPHSDSILVLVGREHVPDLVKILQSQYGFK